MKDNLNFEETMKELEEVVQKLEKGELNLDESIKEFERGMKLSKDASKYLEDAEKKITILVKGEDNNIEEQDF